MKRISLSPLFFAGLLLAASASAQLRDNTDKTLACGSGGDGWDRERHCDMREQTIASTSALSVASHNGGISIKGWSRNDILVRSRVEAWAPTESEAANIANQVSVAMSAGQVKASGPENLDRRGWSVSFEIFAPHSTALDLSSHNGGINVTDVEARITADTHNGGINLTRVGGDIIGTTHNGGVKANLTGAPAGRNLELTSYNGAVDLTVPKGYAGHFEAETLNGAVRTDFPVTVTGNLRGRQRKLDFTRGSGGPSVRVKTHNGAVAIHES